MTPPEEPRKTVFSFNERGFDFDAVDIGGGDALITIRRGNETVRELKFPAYKVYNIAAHANDIVDGLLEESDRGLQIAGSDGLGGEAMIPPDELTPETLRAVFHALWHSRMLVPGPTEEDCLAHVSAWAADRKMKDTWRRVAIQRGDELETLRTRIETLEKDYHELIYAVATKCEGETRHQTALRYIIEREAHGMGDGQPALRGE